jgi:cell wall-associated NlpC family hydrolase
LVVKSVEIDLSVKGDAGAKAKLDDITKRAEALKKTFPSFALKIDSAAASAKLKVFRGELDAATRDRTENIKVKVDDSALQKLKKATGGLSGSPGLLGPALLALPAVGLAGAFTAGAGALAAFGAIAKPVLTDALTASQAVNTAQNNYNAAIAGGTKQAVAYKAEQIAINKAYAELSPAQIALSQQLGNMANAWQNLKAAQTPVVAGALQPWLRSVTSLTQQLGPIIAKVSPVIKGLGGQFSALIGSSAFKGFRDFIAGTGSKVVGAVGGTVIDFVKAFMILLPKFNPLILQMTGGIASLGPAVLKWAASKKTADDITGFMAWFHANGPVVSGLLKNVGGALKALTPGLTSGGALELKALSGFFGFVAKLPPGIAKPLAAVAGALLILNKLGVVKTGINLIGLAAGAGPIGLVALALVAVAAGFTIAWKKSATFRDAIKTLAFAVLDDGIIIVKGFRLIVDAWLSAVGTILHGAADAFGWMPGIGPKLRAASKDFDAFKAGTDSVFNGIIGTMQSWQRQLNASKATVAQATAVIVADFRGQGAAALQGRNDVAAYTTAVQRNGSQSDAARSARARLIADLRASGVGAQTANRLVNNLQTAINRMHGTTVRVNFVGSGSGSIAFRESIPGVTTGPSSAGLLGFHAAGGMIRGGTPGKDSVLGMLMPGEVVVPAHMVQGGAVDHLRGQLPGFAAGGAVSLSGITGPHGILSAGQPYMAKTEEAFGRVVEAAFAKAAIAKFRADAAAALGSGPAIASYAMSFLGKIPYVWGGTSLNSFGADCSGFVQSIYSHFGINAPRTSEAQGGWVKRGPAVPGGLAFYHSPAGGSDPGHVAIVRDASQVISQGGGMGPTLMGINGMPLLWTGVPPGGLPAGGGGGVSAGRMSAASIASLWRSLGGRASAAGNMAAIANAESSDIPSARQTGEPPGLTGWGLYQITPTSGISQNGAYGNLLNASNNTRAAISLYNSSGYLPWASDPVASALIASGLTYDKGGMLRPGLTLAYNGTGRPEQVIPHGGAGAGGVHLHLTVNGPVGSQAELENWYVHTANKMARTGRLTQAVKTAAR